MEPGLQWNISNLDWIAVEHFNSGQTPVVTFDQPVLVLTKEFQWKWPQECGEEKFVVLLGRLYIEITELQTLVTG